MKRTRPMYEGKSSLADTPLIDSRPRKKSKVSKGRRNKIVTPERLSAAAKSFRARGGVMTLTKDQQDIVGAWVELADPHDAMPPPTTWEQVARHAVVILNSITKTRNIDLHRSGIEQCCRAVAILSGQVEMYQPRKVRSM